MRVLVLYATTEGQTEKIARFVAGQVATNGHQVEVFNLNDIQPLLDEYDLVIIGASVHMMKYQAAVKHFVRKNAKTLNDMPTAFLSVSLTAAGGDAEAWAELDKITANFMDITGWRPFMVEQVAGALKYTQYDFFKRWIMRSIAKKEGGAVDTSQDYEYTDWDQLKKFVNAFTRQRKAAVTG